MEIQQCYRQYLPAGKFAKMSHTTRATLQHYDNIGLFSPELRGENNYRYYSTKQLPTINLIHILQELGMTLDEISQLKRESTPKTVSEILQSQMKKIDEQMEKWIKARKLSMVLYDMVNSVENIQEDVINVKFFPAEAIILGKLNDYSQGNEDYDAFAAFYEYMGEHYNNFDFNYPVWRMFTKERILQRDWQKPERFYFYNPEGYDKRPAALYAVGYTHGSYGQTDGLYRKIIEYVDENNYEVCGNAYEEYPLSELSVADASNYLIRIMVTVRKKD